MRHDHFTGRRPGRGPFVAKISAKSQSQVQVDDGYLLALAKQGSADAYERLVRRYYSFVRLKASSYFLIGGDSRRPDPGGPRRALQGDPRLPHRPRVLVPQLRGAVHHAPDHHRGQDGDPQQAHAAQRLRLVLLHARGRDRQRADARRDAPRLDGPRPRQPGDLLRGAALAGRLPLDGAVRARVARARRSTSTATPTRASASSSAATARRSTTRSSGSSARWARTCARATCCCNPCACRPGSPSSWASSSRS